MGMICTGLPSGEISNPGSFKIGRETMTMKSDKQAGELERACNGLRELRSCLVLSLVRLRRGWSRVK